MYLISDNVDTLTGMRLAVGIILLTERLGREFPELLDEIKLERSMPLLIEIPDRHGTGRKKDFITSYVTEAIGLKL